MSVESTMRELERTLVRYDGWNVQCIEMTVLTVLTVETVSM
jgi:hypothetical protein